MFTMNILSATLKKRNKIMERTMHEIQYKNYHHKKLMSKQRNTEQYRLEILFTYALFHRSFRIIARKQLFFSIISLLWV